MAGFIRNIPQGEVVPLADLVDYLPGQVVSKTLVQNAHHSLTLFAFAQGEEISAHVSDGDAFVQVLDGEGKITIGQAAYQLQAGQAIVMPAGVPHAVFAQSPFKMLLTVIFD